MQKIAIIVAGGSGVRMGSALPKQFLMIKNKPVLQYTLETFLLSYPDLQIILVLPNAYLNLGKDLVEKISLHQRIRLVAGGATRFHSVKAGLSVIPAQTNAIIFVHDAVRCLISTKLIQQCYQQAFEKGSAIPAIKATDSIRRTVNNTSKPLNRDEIFLIQTPQTFKSNILLPAFQQEHQPEFTDEATVVEYSGVPIHLIAGEHQNIKITRPIDLLIAEKFLDDPSLF